MLGSINRLGGILIGAAEGALLLCLLFAASHAPAAIRTWDGDGAATSSLWSNVVNWDGDLTAPVSGDALVFSGAQGFLSTNDIAGLNLISISFNTFSGYSLFGNAVTITNGISDSTGSNTNGLPLTLGAAQTVTGSMHLLETAEFGKCLLCDRIGHARAHVELVALARRAALHAIVGRSRPRHGEW